MTDLNKKKHIIFDLGNVVVDIDLSITIDRFNKLGFTDVEKYIGKYKQNGIFCDLEEGTITADEFTSYIQKNIIPNASIEQIAEAWKALILKFDIERIETLIELKKTHKIYILSNTNSLHIEACSDIPIVDSLHNLFDKVYCSHEMKMSKPHKEIFEAVLKDGNMNPEETLYLDDSAANVKAAEDLGIESWLINNPNDWVPKLKALMSEISY